MSATIATDFDFGLVLARIGCGLAERPKLRAAGRNRWFAPARAIAGLAGGGVTAGLTAARALHWVL